MFLAINYSPAAASLVKSGKIDVDYFKTPDWDWLITDARQLRPVAVHFTLEAGNDDLKQVDWAKVERSAKDTGTPYINLHLDARQSFYPDLSLDSTRGYAVKRVIKTILSDVRIVVERFGPERVIIENSPYQGQEGNTLLLCAQPELITQLVEQTGCGLLLDLSHAIITARHLGIQPDNYIQRMPLTKLKEMHFAGIHPDHVHGGWTDHLSIQPDDWHWLDWALNHIHLGDWNSPWLMAFEYGGIGEVFEWRSSPEVISAQIPELYEHIKLLGVGR